MANFSMTCTCGDIMTVEAADREAAVSQLKTIMDQNAIDQHFAAKHTTTEAKPSVEQAHSMVEALVASA